MIDNPLHKGLVKKLKEENAFWSYNQSSIQNTSDDVLILNVLLYLDIEDVHKLFKLYPKAKIQQVWKEHMLLQEPMYHGLNRFYAFHLFGVKNPDRYIRDNKNLLLKKRLCKV